MGYNCDMGQCNTQLDQRIRPAQSSKPGNTQCAFGKHVELAILRFAEKLWVSCIVHSTRKYRIQQKKKNL